jgi:hypothetical protein
MLLCDGCNLGFHTYCLRPPLAAIPDTDWFCLSCKNKVCHVLPSLVFDGDSLMFVLDICHVPPKLHY